ncbi:MAG: hypothetical protein C0504_19445 [Candidatus Solibacter sp.]|nr:hypothetical protein [Candidatus Solibacter sp.]
MRETNRSGFLVLLTASAAVLALGAAAWFYLLRGPAEPAGPPGLSAEAKAYTKHLGLSDFEIKAADSFMRSTLVELLGRITNKGGRKLRVVEITCVFYDSSMQYTVHRERVAIVRAKDGPLLPGQSRNFRLPFDAIPSTWNQATPQMVIAHIEFAE